MPSSVDSNSNTADMVNHPPHYTRGDIECIEAIKAALGPVGFVSYLRGQVIKYLWRCHLKGHLMQDLKKAEFYLGRLLQELGDPEKTKGVASNDLPTTPLPPNS